MRLFELLGFKSRPTAEEVLDTAWKQVRAGKSIESVVAGYPEIAAELEPMLRAMSRTRAAASAPALSPEALVRIEARAQMVARQREHKKRAGGLAPVLAPGSDAASAGDRARLTRAPFGARWQAGLVMALVLLIVLGGLATVLERSKIPITGIVPATATTQEAHVPSVVTREPEITPSGMGTVTAVPSIMAVTATTGLDKPTAIVTATEQVVLPADTPTLAMTSAPVSPATPTVALRPTQTRAPFATATAQLPRTATPTETPVPETSTTVPTVGQVTPVPTDTRQTVATPQASPTPSPTRTTAPIPTPSPTQRILPTETAEPTETAQPSETPVPTRTTRPTQTSVPTQTTAPTQTSVPTQTAVPTQTSAPTQTAVPTQTTIPTQTAVPTQTSDPTETSEPRGTSEPAGAAKR